MLRWDIFCKVIDNYGDIGVAWRLACQLVLDYGLKVRLWVDSLETLSAICPDVILTERVQEIAGVDISHWSDDVVWEDILVADVVVETFACPIPQGYKEAMARLDNAPYWLNLEYLTAENWAVEWHMMTSPQQGGLNKIFYFPGFKEQSGGLLREKGLLERRDELDKAKIWSELTQFKSSNDALKIVLFGYERMPLKDWLPLLIDSEQIVQLVVTSGQAAKAFKKAWRELGLTGNQHGHLEVQFIPMLAQNQFDELLWSADLNFVRGEDSLVRAIWSAQPFVWHIYEQTDGAHWPKLEAFLELYTSESWCNLMRCWNGDLNYKMSEVWQTFLHDWSNIQSQAQHTCGKLAQIEDLAQQLVRSSGVYTKK